MAINVDSRGRTVEESVVLAMDGTDASLYPYLPYILQDIWQIGASPDLIIQVLRRRLPRKAGFRLLDLGCGKGAVSIPVAAAFDCSCLGIDAVEAFVAEARARAAEHGVDARCRFEVGDIREVIKGLAGFDVIVLGARFTGPFLGDYWKRSRPRSPLIVEGLFYRRRGYFHDAFPFTPSSGASVILREIEEAGMNWSRKLSSEEDPAN